MPMKIHVSKIMNLQSCKNETTFLLAFIWIMLASGQFDPSGQFDHHGESEF